MPKRSNPLLIDVRTILKNWNVPCIRIYTTTYKDGGCRVKFYGLNYLPSLFEGQLRCFGWKDVTVTLTLGRGPSVTLKARK